MKKILFFLIFSSICLYSAEFKGVKLITLNESQLLNLGIKINQSGITYLEKNESKSSFKNIVISNGTITTKNAKAKDTPSYSGIQPRFVEYSYEENKICYFSKISDFNSTDNSNSDEKARNREKLAAINNLVGVKYDFTYKSKKGSSQHHIIFWYPENKLLMGSLPDNNAKDLANEQSRNQSNDSANFVNTQHLESPLLQITNLYPNPVTSGNVKIKYQLKDDKYISIMIYDINGKMVNSLMPEQMQYAGSKDFSFGMDDLINGTYIVLISANTGESVYSRIIKVN